MKRFSVLLILTFTLLFGFAVTSQAGGFGRGNFGRGFNNRGFGGYNSFNTFSSGYCGNSVAFANFSPAYVAVQPTYVQAVAVQPTVIAQPAVIEQPQVVVQPQVIEQPQVVVAAVQQTYVQPLVVSYAQPFVYSSYAGCNGFGSNFASTYGGYGGNFRGRGNFGRGHVGHH